MSASTSRRSLLRGCAAVALAAMSDPAWALPAPRLAPRAACNHTGCRHHRPDEGGPGICGLALGGRVLLPHEETP